ncbi:hypothetical protein D3C78_1673390 [compost metagenome]
MGDHAVLHFVTQRRWMQRTHLPACQPWPGIVGWEIAQMCPGQHPMGHRFHMMGGGRCPNRYDRQNGIGRQKAMRDPVNGLQLFDAWLGHFEQRVLMPAENADFFLVQGLVGQGR